MPDTILFAQAPQLRRRDFVFNANDNHWLRNPNSPLENFDVTQGFGVNHKEVNLEAVERQSL